MVFLEGDCEDHVVLSFQVSNSEARIWGYPPGLAVSQMGVCILWQLVLPPLSAVVLVRCWEDREAPYSDFRLFGVRKVEFVWGQSSNLDTDTPPHQRAIR